MSQKRKRYEAKVSVDSRKKRNSFSVAQQLKS